MTSSRTIAFCSLPLVHLHVHWQFPLQFQPTPPLGFKFSDGAMVMNPWRSAGLRPTVDALGKQTNRDIHHCAADDAPEMCHIRLLSAGLHSAYTAPEQCCRRAIILESWVGENTLALFSTSRNMLNGQLWLEKTDFKKCANCYFPNVSH